ncbi:hypothetical protein SAMN02746041_02204 [Desulfacinum hydrothermale DSM 13146]|uniref:Uncharacterized protein n=1 Tax=Desulfacinum hydrothermale DSM 13146 TaxID=1121390 RepID=A0A1W1XNN5_9BACT|nr:TIGR01777 family oxidoreductase [Desulfacinum hydrothermale]SMC25131.1 hypothetical protein SAMN02746041_02204 [Desulfacinum hydrothermale DSM 13146]
MEGDFGRRKRASVRLLKTSCVVPAPRDEVFHWHARPGALERLTPPWERVEVRKRSGGIEPGAEAFLRVWLGPVPLGWHARHTVCDPPRLFVDEQVSGPFASWRHEHHFEALNPGETLLTDEVRYRLRGPRWLRDRLDMHVRRRLEGTFRYRYRTLVEDIRLIRQYGVPPLRVVVTGSAGVIGSHLVPFLTAAGHEVVRLVRRRPKPGQGEVFWDPYAGVLDVDALGSVDAVIHLAGDPIGSGRWSEGKKRRILESRTRPTRFLAETMARMKEPPRVLVSASAVGIYGGRGDRLLMEEDPPGTGFLSQVCRRWEEAAQAFEGAGRLVRVRIGIALTPRGGALAELLPAARCRVVPVFGSGRQFWSWVHVDDVVGAIYHALCTESVQGPVNVTAPQPVRQEECVRTLGQVLGGCVVVRIPERIVGTAMGEKGREILFSSARVFPRRLLATGYRFRYPDLGQALAALLGRTAGKNPVTEQE